MKTHCPCCGAEISLDALLAHEEARAAVWAVAHLGGETVRLAVKYLGLFRPSKTALSFERMTKLINEVLPDMQRGAVSRNGVEYPAPIEAWNYAFREMVNRRNSGSLKLPLKSHGYLYEVIVGWKGQGLKTAPVQQAFRQPENSSQTLSAVAALQEMKHE